MSIDLHTHSTASDGILTPTSLLEQAQIAGLSTIALTDHDTTDGLDEAEGAGRARGIEVIAGIELNTNLAGTNTEVHVLGYFIDRYKAGVQERLQERRDARERRGRRMVEQLQAAGVPVTWEQVQSHARGAVGRPHVAAALIDAHIVTSVNEAFEHWLSPGKPGFVPREYFTPVQAIELIAFAGGVASLAHPYYIPDLPTLLPELVNAGLAGLETYYGQYDATMEQTLLDLGSQYHLIPTGGSDYHGPNMHPTPLGGHAVPDTSLAALRARHALNL